MRRLPRGPSHDDRVDRRRWDLARDRRRAAQHGRDDVFGFFARLAEETGGTFRLDIHDVLANDEHAIALCTLSATRGGKSMEVPVANVHHIRDGKVTEFWGATADPQATIDFWV